jgi:spore maturation protein CgeB
VEALARLDVAERRRLAEAARARVLAYHTYAHRARKVSELLDLGLDRGAAA